MSNDLLKLVNYISENKNEYDFLMNEYERLIHHLDYENYSVEFLIQMVKTFEDFETEYSDVNKQKRRFLKNVIKNIKFKLDLDFFPMKSETLVNCFYFLNTDFGIQKYEKLNKFIFKIRKKIFDILIKRGVRYYLHTKAGYILNLTDPEKFFFQQYQVVIFNFIRKNEKEGIKSFIERKNDILETERLDAELIDYKKK